MLCGGVLRLQICNDLTRGFEYLIELEDWSDFAAFYQTLYLKSYASLAVREGESVLDAGANIGTWAVLASRLVGDMGWVVAVEPDATNYRKLLRNLQLNGIANVHPVRRALWSVEGRVVRLEGEGCMVRVGDGGSQEVITDTIDSLAKSQGGFDVIKMDIEGAEVEALRGAGDSLPRCRQLALEVHGRERLVAVRALLEAGSFRSHISPAESLGAALRTALLHPLLTVNIEGHNKFRTSQRILRQLFGRAPDPAGMAETWLLHATRASHKP